MAAPNAGTAQERSPVETTRRSANRADLAHPFAQARLGSVPRRTNRTDRDTADRPSKPSSLARTRTRREYANRPNVYGHMRAPLTHDEHLRVLACVQEIYRCRSLQEFPAHVLRAFAPLIPSNLAAFNEVNVPRERLLVAYSHPIRDEARLRRNFERYSGEHPIIRYILETGDGQAVKISDFVSPRAYHRLAIYRHVYEALGAEDQLSLTIRSDAGVIIAVAFNRPRRTFTEEERVML